jgi:predicted regulator of Ras-like GTPase activity (Roadblock/LC7/MglB family)
MQLDDPGALRVPALTDLQDIPGVIGTLLISHDGSLLMQALPPGMQARADEAAPRLAVLLEALAAGRQPRDFSLRFAEHRLLVAPLVDAFLCVIAELQSPAAMLRMALHVMARRLS